MNTANSTFTQLDSTTGAGEPLPPTWRPVTTADCLILVGLTGVGKTTTLRSLTSAIQAYTLLPDRRTLTDLLMIPTVQQHDGLPLEAVTDRSQRFALTRRYRELHPGGMAYTLSTLALSPQAVGLIIFDGLRGENEIRHAAALTPRARFLMLDAPDVVRIQRLLSRQDAFDGITSRSEKQPYSQAESFAAIGVSEAGEVLTAEQQRTLLQMASDGIVSVEDLASKTRIVLAERKNYDPVATRVALQQLAPYRRLIVDTDRLAPPEIAHRTLAWLNHHD